jgi:hypothetical protein
MSAKARRRRSVPTSSVSSGAGLAAAFPICPSVKSG